MLFLKTVINSYFVGPPYSRLIVQQIGEWSLNKRVCAFFIVCWFFVSFFKVTLLTPCGLCNHMPKPIKIRCKIRPYI